MGAAVGTGATVGTAVTGGAVVLLMLVLVLVLELELELVLVLALVLVLVPGTQTSMVTYRLPPGPNSQPGTASMVSRKWQTKSP